VTGALDTGTAPALREALCNAARTANPHLVIDLAAVTVLDATGLHALFAARYHHDRHHGGHLAAVINPATRAIPKIYVLALTMAFDLHTSTTQALRACAHTDTDHTPSRHTTAPVRITCTPHGPTPR
jgi:anti-anti-sigma factor